MFGFGPKKTSTPMFPVQEDGRFGSVWENHRTESLDEAMGPGGAPEGSFHGRFLGLTIPLRRFRIAAVCVVCILSIFVGRAAQLQIVEGSLYREQAEGNRERTRLIVPPRGLIFDRNGIVLAENVSTFTLTMTIADLPKDPDVRGDELNRVADLSGIHRADLDLLLSENAKRPADAIPVKRGLPYDGAIRLAIAIADLPGFQLETSATRSYDTSANSLSHVLGYTGNVSPEELERLGDAYRPTDHLGKAGVEKSAEELLRGRPGRLVVEVNARGDEISLVSKVDPIPGANLTLTIDEPFQQFVETRLAATLEAANVKRGVVVAIDPKTGGIRALVSLPSFDSNAFANGIDEDVYQALIEDPDHPLFSRAIAGEYPSGSTFKPFMSYAALAEGIVTPSTSFVSTGGLSVGGSFFPDWKAGGHGVTDVRKAIAWSVNTYFYIIGGGYNDFTGLGVDRITTYARQFGFGKKTGIDLPGEADGFLPSKDWKREAKGERWYVGDTYHLAIGQGDLNVTPIQLATGIAMIANRGTRIEPHVIEGIDGAVRGTENIERPTAEEPFDASAIQVVREGMRQTVTLGSGRYLSLLDTPVAGKTGTAQTGGNRPNHAWFTGFGPYDDPNIAIVVLVEYGQEGSTVAVPLAKEIFEWWFAHNPE